MIGRSALMLAAALTAFTPHFDMLDMPRRRFPKKKPEPTDHDMARLQAAAEKRQRKAARRALLGG